MKPREEWIARFNIIQSVMRMVSRLVVQDRRLALENTNYIINRSSYVELCRL